MEDKKKWQIPTFGNWDYSDEMPITQYFESARKAGLVRTGFSDLVNVPVAMPVKFTYQDATYRRKVRKRNVRTGEERSPEKKKERKPRKPVVAPKAVDEDLYKIPPELLCQKPKSKRFLRSFLSGCLGLNCIA